MKKTIFVIMNIALDIAAVVSLAIGIIKWDITFLVYFLVLNEISKDFKSILNNL